MFGFMGRILGRGELISWINGPSVLGYARAVDFVQYPATKGFVTVRFNDQIVVSKVLASNPLSFNQALVCVLPWDSRFLSGLG